MKRAFFSLNAGRQRVPSAWLVAVALSSCLVIVLVLIAYVKYDTVSDLRGRERKLQRQVNALQAIKKQYQELESRVQGLQKKLGKIDKLTVGGLRRLRDNLVAIARAIPDDAKLQTLTFDTHWLECEGSARTARSVTLFLAHMVAQPCFKDVRLLSIGSNQTKSNEKSSQELPLPVTFKIRMQRV